MSARFGWGGAEGEGQQGFGREGAEASLWMEGQRSARGYRVSCKEGGAGPLCCQTEMRTTKIGWEQEELLLYLAAL